MDNEVNAVPADTEPQAWEAPVLAKADISAHTLNTQNFGGDSNASS
jgi:hypothetical protein